MVSLYRDHSLLDNATGETASQKILVRLLRSLGLIHVNDGMINGIVDEGVYIYIYTYDIHIAMM